MKIDRRHHRRHGLREPVAQGTYVYPAVALIKTADKFSSPDRVVEERIEGVERIASEIKSRGA